MRIYARAVDLPIMNTCRPPARGVFDGFGMDCVGFERLDGTRRKVSHLQNVKQR